MRTLLALSEEVYVDLQGGEVDVGVLGSERCDVDSLVELKIQELAVNSRKGDSAGLNSSVSTK